jgi:hypothetical protein
MLRSRFLQSNPLLGVSFSGIARDFRVIYKAEKPQFTNHMEFDAQRKLMKMYRGKMITAFWDRHAQVENNAINAYNRQQEAVAKRRDRKKRGSLVKLSYGLFRQQNHAHETEKKKQKVLQGFLLDQENQRLNNLKIYKALEHESKYWVRHGRLNETLNQGLLIPKVGVSMTEYYLRLKEMTFFLIHGDYEAMEYLSEDVEATQFKNTKMIPLFTEVKMAVKHLSVSKENQVIADYQKAVLKLKKAHVSSLCPNLFAFANCRNSCRTLLYTRTN